ncbi:MAG TPA: AMP-binding protein, partial [Smithellaceae bacterium]|nr:AMP-binding protein [Smithellaceae bacterium]
MSGFVNKTMGDVIEETAGRFPDHPALIAPQFQVRLNYRELYEQCRKTARGLMAMGVRRGDHVSVWTTNVPEWVYLQFALGMVGGILVTINTNYQSHELEYILRQSDSTTLFLIDQYRDTSFYETVRKVVPELGSCEPGKTASAKLPVLKNVVYIGNRESAPGMFKFSDLIAMGESVSEQELGERMSSLTDDDVINMQYTSGTTGFPKGVMLTHHNVINNARMVGDVMGLTDKDTLLIQVPVFHCFGCVMSTLNSVY